jgi:hypothetical protein
MNRARKHELERNVLAERIESATASVQPILPVLLGIIAVVAVGSIMWGVYSSSVSRRQAAAWTEFYFNLSGADAETYLDVADAYPRSDMAGWARLAAGDNYLHKGIEALYVNRSEGEENLKLAISTFEDVLNNAKSEELRSKAMWGLGQAHESLGQLEEATRYYEQFTAATTQTQLVNAATERLAFINSSTGKQFYQWFSKLEPKPDAPIELPSGMSLPPMTPDLQFGPDSGISLPDFTTPSQQNAVPPSTPPQDPAPQEIAPQETAPAAGGESGVGADAESAGPSSQETVAPAELPDLQLSPPSGAAETSPDRDSPGSTAQPEASETSTSDDS